MRKPSPPAPLPQGERGDESFVDGNKRTATLVCLGFLAALGIDVETQRDLKIRVLGEVAVETAAGGLDVAGVAVWLRRIFGRDPVIETDAEVGE